MDSLVEMLVRRRRLVSSRRGVLLCLLGVLGIVLAVSFRDLAMAYQLMAARKALRKESPERAAEILQHQSSASEQSPEWQFLLARALRRSNHLDEARRQLDRAKAAGAEEIDLYREDILLKARQGQIIKVEKLLVQLLESGLDDDAAEDIYEAMSQGYWASFYVEDALKALKHWREWQPDKITPHLWIADLYERSERREAAEAEYGVILEIDPHHAEALAKLGSLQLKRLAVAEAAETFGRCLVAAPETPEALLGLAECRRRQGLNDEAKDLLFDALTLELTSLETGRATGVLGTLALEDRNYRQAVQLLHQSVSLSPDYPTTHVSLAAALTALGQDELAAQVRERARETSDRHSRLMHTTNKVIEEPANAELRAEAGLILIEQGLWPEGADWLFTAIEIDPQLRSAQEGLARYFEHIGDLDRAKQHRAAAEQAPLPTIEGASQGG